MAKVIKEEKNLENVLREMVRDVITEELTETTLSRLGYDEWLQNAPSPDEQTYGRHEDVPTDPGEYPEDGYDETMVDPEDEMDPQTKENLINSLLDLEFQESATKSIPVASLKEMIRKSVKKHLR